MLTYAGVCWRIVQSLRDAAVELCSLSRVPQLAQTAAAAAAALSGASVARVLLLSTDGASATEYTHAAGTGVI
jgi:hypothetical protein